MSEHGGKKPEGGDRAGAQPDAAEGGAAAPRAPRDPRAAKWQMIVQAATAYNKQHPDLVAEFNKLTDGTCAGDNAGVSVRELKRWQMHHGLPADGKVGKDTIAAAKKAKPQKPDGEGKDDAKAEDVTVSDEEAAADAQGGGGGDLAVEAVAGGETGGEEKREPKGGGSFEGDGLAADGADKFGKDVAGGPSGELQVPEGMEAPAEEGAGKVGAAGKAGIAVATRAVLIPHIVSLLRQHEYKKAITVVTDSVGWEDRVELVKLIVEKCGAELGPIASKWFERAIIGGAVADVAILGWEWTMGGIKAVQEAHEHGDRDSRIGIYAYAWSDTVLRGSHSNPGAVDEEERKAMKLGIQDGEATRSANPELPFLLRAEYGNDEDNARRALQDALYKKAGISGIKTHHGK
jgi:hypothetical protein